MVKSFDDKRCPKLLIKVSNNIEHLKELANGKIYLKESGYFRNLENDYQGDKFDGKRPINLKDKNCKIVIGADDDPSKMVFYGDEIKDFCLGFPGDDKVPMFCASLVSDSILTKINGTEVFTLTDEFINEVKQFGEHFIIFDYSYFITEIQKYAKENSISFRCNKIEYGDIMNKYSFEDSRYYGFASKDIYSPFFFKRDSYRFQNEWRLILYGKELIKQGQDYYSFQIPKMKNYHVGTWDSIQQFQIIDDE